MLEARKEKEPTKAEVIKKLEAWKTLNSVLVQQSQQFIQSLNNILAEKQIQHDQLKEKLENNEGTDEDNATFIFLGGYVQCLKDILHIEQQAH